MQNVTATSTFASRDGSAAARVRFDGELPQSDDLELFFFFFLRSRSRAGMSWLARRELFRFVGSSTGWTRGDCSFSGITVLLRMRNTTEAALKEVDISISIAGAIDINRYRY